MHKMLYLLQGTANFLFSAVLSFYITQPTSHQKLQKKVTHPTAQSTYQEMPLPLMY